MTNLMWYTTLEGEITFDAFISTSGNDSTGDGTFGNPWRTLVKGLSSISNGETLGVRGGTYDAETINSTCNGTNGSPRTARPYTGEQAVFDGKFVFTTGCSDISFIGDEAVREGETAGTFRFVNATVGEHVIEMYGTRIIVSGCDIDHDGGYEGSCVAMGWNGAAGQWRAVECEVTDCLVRNIGLDPSYTNSTVGHDHGLYLNYNLDCVISGNVIVDILSGWGIHLYTESGSARDVDSTTVTFNTVYETRDGGMILGSNGTSTSENTTADNNLFSNCGDSALTQGAYTFMVFWGGSAGTGNTATDNHSYLPGDGDEDPGLSDWTITGTTNGDPDFVNAAAGDFHIQSGSPADGTGAYPTPV